MPENNRDQVLQEFKEYYRALPNHKDIFYMFFTTGLLFWVKKSLSLIPESTNVVLICAGLEQHEIQWVTTQQTRPAFFISAYCDDREIWELLFQVNQENFGWIDIDCFVFNPDLFKEMAAIRPDVAINCVWSYQVKNSLRSELDLLNTYFLFINVDVIRMLQSKDIPISPRTYIYRETDAVAFTKANLIGKEQLEIIEEVFAKDTYPSYPSVPNGFNIFDTLLMYQLTAQHYGYKLNKVRDLNPDHYYSDEVIHIGGSSNFSPPQYANMPIIDIADRESLYYMIAYTVLAQSIHHLPYEYRLQEKMMVLALKSRGVAREDVIPAISAYVCHNGLKESTAERLFRLT